MKHLQFALIASQKHKLRFLPIWKTLTDEPYIHISDAHSISIPYGEGISALLTEYVKINIWLQTETRES